MDAQAAEIIGKASLDAIEKRGYVFWRCQALQGDIIAIIKIGGFWRDRAVDCSKAAIEKGKLKEVPPIYTMEEIRVLCDNPNLLLMHAAKKMGLGLEQGEPQI